MSEPSVVSGPVGRTSGVRVRGGRLAAALAGALLAVAVVAGSAFGSYGDSFGIAPINGPDGQSVPALPGESHAFWAGTCDIGAAPAIGQDMSDQGGIGERPDTILAPDKFRFGGFIDTFNRTAVDAPELPPHCLEWEAPGEYPAPNDSIWLEAPSWRLPAHAQAGGHPDGTATMALSRTPEDFSQFGEDAVDGSVDNIYVDLPPGLVGDPTAVGECSAERFAVRPMLCPPDSQVGVLHLVTEAVGVLGSANLGPFHDERVYPIYNLEPREGNVAELGFGYATSEKATTVRIVAKARTNSDFGVTTFVGQIPAALPLIQQQITLWGVPWSADHDLWRAQEGLEPGAANGSSCAAQPGTGEGANISHYLPPAGLREDCQGRWGPSWGQVRPFVSNVTECTGSQLHTRLAIDSYQNPAAFGGEGDPLLPPFPALPAPGTSDWQAYSSPAPAMHGCEKVPFDADLDLEPTSSAADSATGMSVALELAQNDQLPFPAPADGATDGQVADYLQAAADHWRSDAGLATSQLDRAVVTLPAGMALNPSAAAGLRGCSDAQIGLRQAGNPPLFNNGDPFDKDGGADGAECPDASKIGTVIAHTPVLDEPLTGEVVLGAPKDTNPQSGDMLRLFLVLRNEERGLIAKVHGSSVADPATGQLTTTFDKNPRVPVERFELDFKGGPRGLLAMPQRCGDRGWVAQFSPWTAAHGAGGQPVHDGGTFTADSNCAFGFAPTMNAGMDTQKPRGSGTMAFDMARRDGEQWLRAVTAKLPGGLVGSLRHVTLCSNAQAAANACPLASQIGIVDATAGSGDPFALERPGRVYLTDSYRGGEFGLAVSVPVEAGPFRGAMALDPIVVRQALHVDRRTAEVTVISDPFPLVHHGIPLRTRRVVVKIDREDFMLNPSGCDRKQIGADIRSAQGTTVSRTARFQAAGCRALAFRPRLAMRLTGRRQVKTGRHPGVRALVRQRGVREAGIQRARVALPKSLALDPANAQALCEFEDGTKPDLEDHCPDGSIVGRARAVSPLLKEPLAGDVYFVKNIRIDPDTGNEIRTLPMIVVALRGEISINLRGQSSTTEAGKLVNTFADVPDAPITRFNLNIRGGRNGILAVTRTQRGEINLCTAGPQIARAAIAGHNGKRHDQNIAIRKPCAKRRQPAAKVCRKRTNNRTALRRCVRNAKKAGAKRAAAQRAAKRKAATRRAPTGKGS